MRFILRGSVLLVLFVAWSITLPVALSLGYSDAGLDYCEVIGEARGIDSMTGYSYGSTRWRPGFRCTFNEEIPVIYEETQWIPWALHLPVAAIAVATYARLLRPRLFKWLIGLGSALYALNALRLLDWGPSIYLVTSVAGLTLGIAGLLTRSRFSAASTTASD
jgi:hypothetical protein